MMSRTHLHPLAHTALQTVGFRCLPWFVMDLVWSKTNHDWQHKKTGAELKHRSKALVLWWTFSAFLMFHFHWLLNWIKIFLDRAAEINFFDWYESCLLSNSELSRLSNWETEKFLYFYFQLVVHKRQEVISLMGHQLYANYSNKKASLHTFHKLPNKVGINGHIQEPLLYF